jgi:CDP-diacylglycerol--serine O-phosphatidyltransferase
MPKQKKVINRGIYLLPNLFTTAGLFAGFYAIVSAMNADFRTAAIAIFVAMLMDALDGRVARMTQTESAFGAEYDSLTDIVAFGVAPALVIYSWGLSELGKIGWLIAFLHTASMALRLARFNSQLSTSEKTYFTGLPAPAAAAVVVGFVWVNHEMGFLGANDIMAAIITFVVSILMVSQIRYYSFKNIDLRGRVPFFVLLCIVLALVGIAFDPPKVLFAAFTVYALSGPVLALRRNKGLNGLKRYIKK